ncbi:RNA polymerase sigma factor [Litorimonas sp. WD9-15]|uniref:RNA polymerase sigma factor n=1 Tax=Litorimonas sp. WD9-15 TaxID=3418716 RepID=UPI003D067C71
MSEIYSRHAGPLTGFAKRCLAHEADADDIVHETMMEVWRRPERFEGRSSLKSWMFAIARFKSYDRNRKSGRTVLSDMEDSRVCEDALPSDALAASQDASRVRAAMNTLSEPHRRALHLSFFEDMTYKEIAEVEGCPVGTIKTRILHAKRKMITVLGQMEA